jgi:hypothetical protein
MFRDYKRHYHKVKEVYPDQLIAAAPSAFKLEQKVIASPLRI